MTVSEYLKQVRSNQKMIELTLAQLEHAKRERDSLFSPVTDSVHVQSNNHSDRVAKLAVRIADLEGLYYDHLVRIIQTKYNAQRLIDNLTNVSEWTVLTERYINLKDFEDIAEDNNWSTSKVFKIHSSALHKVDLYYRKKNMAK